MNVQVYSTFCRNFIINNLTSCKNNFVVDT